MIIDEEIEILESFPNPKVLEIVNSEAKHSSIFSSDSKLFFKNFKLKANIRNAEF